jgi:hypothetical protein
MSTAALAMRRNQNLYRQPARLQMGPLSASFLVVAIVAVLAMIYLNQVGKTAILGSKLSTLQTQRDQALADRDALSVEAARLQSIQQIQSSKTVAAMTPATNVTYAK